MGPNPIIHQTLLQNHLLGLIICCKLRCSHNHCAIDWRRPSACIRTIATSAGLPIAAPTAPEINPATILRASGMPVRVVEYRVWRSIVAETPEKRALAPSDWMIRRPMERGPTRGRGGTSKVVGKDMLAAELKAKAGR
ncbi:hypothetical protein NC652_019580 [Populus alba x Populus x berolinensis]|nr:hypothetical protein NC652_019580 [Populus alba x Populus x berolinensis]